MLLTGSQGREARRVLRTVSRRLLGLRPSSIAGPSLADGHAGIALAHAALKLTFPKEGHAAHAARALDRAIDGLARESLPPALFGGFAGIAWAAELLLGDPAAPPEEDLNAPIDAALETYLARTPWTESYDLIDGLVGLGVYALERVPRPSAKRLVALVVRRLGETARRRAPGVAWWSDPKWVPRQFRRTPNADYNLGVAHGVPGAIAVLGRIAAADVDVATKKKARALAEGAVAWLIAQELPSGAAGCFAHAVAPKVPREPARLAWCYGDAGVAAALLVAGRAMGKPSWESVAVRLALRAATRPFRTTGAIDASLCHGAAGLGHIFHRMFRSTGEKRLAEAARFWFAHTVGMHGVRRGFAGFASWGPDAKGTLAWRSDPGFLTGAAGIALALAAAIAEDPDPVWDRVLLLS
jgi:lantibiotic modifying enzyme